MSLDIFNHFVVMHDDDQGLFILELHANKDEKAQETVLYVLLREVFCQYDRRDRSFEGRATARRFIMVEISKYTEKYNNFARELLWKIYKEKEDQNIVMSPFSVLMLLAIAADATTGDTRN